MANYPLNQNREAVILIWTEYDTSIYWRLTGTADEIEMFQLEVEQYNKWIQNYLLKGLAPPSSYAKQPNSEPDYDEEIINQLLFYSNPKYKSIFAENQQMQWLIQQLHSQGFGGFDLIYIHNPEKNYVDVDYSREIIEQNLRGLITYENFEILSQIIVAPWLFGLEHTMGYRLLPITKHLISSS